MSTATVTSKSGAEPAATARSINPNSRRLGRPPIPHEHGAWVILYAPLIIAFAIAWPVATGPSLLLVLGVTGAYLARHVAALWLRQRGKANTRNSQNSLVLWLAVYSVVAFTGLLPLLVLSNLFALLQLALVVTALFAAHSLLATWPSRKRLDRSQWGEILGIGALTLTAPAAWVVAGHPLDATAWLIWLACTLFFASGVLHVKMLLAAAKIKDGCDACARWHTGRTSVIYHLLMIVAVGYGAAWLGGWAALLGVLAYLPVIVRGLWSVARLTNVLPPLKRVGIVETAYAVWFTLLLSVALR